MKYFRKFYTQNRISLTAGGNMRIVYVIAEGQRMFGHTRSVLNGDYQGLPDFLLPKAKKHNTLWGQIILCLCSMYRMGEKSTF